MKNKEGRKIRICCNNGAKIHSKRTAVVPLSEVCDPEDNWDTLSMEKKNELVELWINQAGWLDIWFEEIE